MAREKYRFRMYENLAASAPKILAEAQESAADLGLFRPDKALQQGLMNHPPSEPTPPHPIQAHSAPQQGRSDARPPIAHSDWDGERQREDLTQEIRVLVKEALGDGYDACPVASTSLGLALCRRVAIPLGASQHLHGRAVILVPRMKPSEMLASCSPVPPKYATLPEFRSTSGGESAEEAAAAIVPLIGAFYGYHGIIPGQVSMIANAIPEASLKSVAATAEAYLPWLAALFAPGTGIPGCAFDLADSDHIQTLHSGLGEIASEFDVPFIVDNSAAIPFLGLDLVKDAISAATFGPFGAGRAGLVIGTEEAVLPMLEASGLISRSRPASGLTREDNAEVAAVLPAPRTLRGMLRLLTDVRENPERYMRLVGRIYDTIAQEFAQLSKDFRAALRLRKSLETLSVEVNYEDTWNEGVGFPVFSREDALGGTHLLREGLRAMGVTSISVSDASITIGPTRNSPEDEPNITVDHERLRLEVRALVALLRILGKHAGYPV